MKKITMLAALAVGTAVGQVYAADAPKTDWTSESGKLTVLQVINVGDTLRQLGTYRDTAGQTHEVAFKFDGTVLLTMAVDIDAADRVSKNYQTAFTAKRHEMGLDVALDKDAQKPERDAYARKQADFGIQAEKMMGAPAGAVLARIKAADLCIDAKPVAPCTTTNAIPPSLLAAIWPIIEH